LKNNRNLKDKNILFLVHNYNSFQKDQIESVARYFNKVYVIVRYKPISKIAKWFPIKFFKKYQDKYVIDLRDSPQNVEVFRAPVYYLPFGLFNKLLGFLHYNAVDRIVRGQQIKFDLIHAHFLWSAGYVGMRLKEKYDKSLVITGHGYDVYKLPFYSEWWTNKIKIIGNSADLVITVSEGNRKKLLEIGIPNPKIKILPNGYNSKLFYKLDKALIRKEKGIPEQSKVLVSVGNLEEVKGHKDFIEAVKYLKKEYPEILCYIIGGGSLQDYLKSLIREYDLEDNVFLVGYLTHEKINKWMNLSDLFVLPSLQESFGIVQLEAFATGAPVVATRTVGSRELIKSDENGLLTSIGNPKEMAENIKKGLEREWDEDNILNYVEGYSWQRIGRETAQEYEKIL